MLVRKLNRDLNGFPQSKATGFGLDVLQLVPHRLGYVLLDQGLLGLDVGEVLGPGARQDWSRAGHQGVDGEHVTGYERNTQQDFFLLYKKLTEFSIQVMSRKSPLEKFPNDCKL